MAKIVTVFTGPESELQRMEDAATSFNIAVGPFGESDEAKFVEFLATKLHHLRAVRHKGTHHQLYLYLKPGKSGWLIEQINRHSHLGLSMNGVAGLILDASAYKGSINQLWDEAASFNRPKYFWHDSSSGWFTNQLRQLSERKDCAGIYLNVHEKGDTQRHNAFVGLLAEAKIGNVTVPVWTEYLPSEEYRTKLVSLGSSGHYATLDQLPKK